MTMEFLDGMSLRAALQNGPMAPQRVVKILIQCCASLAEAHSIGIIHRDIKPDNLFLLNMAGSPDFVKLLDFSVAKLLQEGDRMSTQAGVVFGTPQYMSPEQGRGLPLDARSDLYALGVLAFEMLTGMVPFHDENPMTVIQMHLRSEIPPMAQAIPYAVQSIVRRALEKDPGRRYQSSGEMMQHCQQVFSELNQGGVSVGAGGMMKTAFAAPPMQQPPMQQHMQQPPMQQPPMQQPPMQHPPQQQYMQASPMQKTMIAQPSPFAGGQMPQQMQPGGLAPAQQGFVQSSPMQKTIVAGLSPPMMNGPGMGMPPQQQMPPQGYPQNQPQASGPNKTVLLQPSDGVVSVARQGGALQAAGGAKVVEGASALFWIICLVMGIGVGVLAYVIVLQTS
jgi:serine/threonine-protein kinase